MNTQEEELVSCIGHHAEMVSSLARRIGNPNYGFEKRSDKNVLMEMDDRICRLIELHKLLYKVVLDRSIDKAIDEAHSQQQPAGKSSAAQKEETIGRNLRIGN